MIELRWHKDKEALAGGCAAVLQYRYLMVTFGPHWAMHGLPDNSLDRPTAQWSDWADVPKEQHDDIPRD